MWSGAIAAIGRVGGPFIDAVVGLAVERVYSKLTNENLQFDAVETVHSKLADENLQFNDEFHDLKDELRYMMTFLKDVEIVNRNQRTETLKTIMADIRELVYDAEDIIDDYNHQFLTQSSRKLAEASSSSSASSLNVSNQLKQQLLKITQSIKKVKDRMAYLGIVRSGIGGDKDWINKPLCYPILSNEDELVGLKDNLQKIMQWFPGENEPFKVIGFVGMGGIGKTTLAEKIYGEAQSHFRHSLFVTVSQNFRLEELIKSILRKLHVQEESMKGDARDLLKTLKSELDGKYFIVLDDVWGVDEGYWWQTLRSGLPQINGSCMIVTTRNEEVAKSMGAVEGYIHRPKLLSDEDCWSLFSKTAFQSNGGHCPNESIEEIGREIVSKCGRLPLAIKIMGGMMLAKGGSIHKWRLVLDQLKEGFAAGKKDALLISTLELSYEDLPAHLKPCLLCFAAYPEDYIIDMPEIVCWWIGEEFIGDKDGKSALDVGEEYFMELVNRCLLTGHEKDYLGEKFVSCRMHDLVKEMIVNIAKEENFIDMNDRFTMPERVPSRRRARISDSAEAERIKSNSKLRTLVLEESDWDGSGCELHHLRVIHGIRRNRYYTSCGVRCKDWISSLRHLTYIVFECKYSRELQYSFGKCLQVLIIRGNCLEKLPTSDVTMEKLCVLEMDRLPGKWTLMSEGLEKYPNLQRLVGPAFRRLEELKKLRGLVELSFLLKKKDDVGEALKALSNLPRLKILKMGCIFVKSLKTQVDIRPLPELQELHILELPSEIIPAWLNPTNLPRLRLLRIESFQIVCKWIAEQHAVWKYLEAFILNGRRAASMEVYFQENERSFPSLRLLLGSAFSTNLRKQDGKWISAEVVLPERYLAIW